MSRCDWLNRSLIDGPFLVLCLSPEAFEDAMNDLELPAADRPRTWLVEGFNACVHHLTPPGRDRANVVCLGDTTGRDALEVAGLLVHEAVHCFQRTCLWAGEDRPSEEFEAYAIQNIAMRLMDSYARQKGWRE